MYILRIEGYEEPSTAWVQLGSTSIYVLSVISSNRKGTSTPHLCLPMVKAAETGPTTQEKTW